MEIDRFTLGVVALISLQAIQLARTVVLERFVRKSLRPPPAARTRGTPVVFERDTPDERARAKLADAMRGVGSRSTRCTWCDGSGMVEGDACGACRGSGRAD